MEIYYLGLSSFKIRGKDASVLTDPFSSEAVGFKFPKIETNIITFSNNKEENTSIDQIEGSPFVIKGPGEYEVKDVSVFGIATSNKNTVYLVEQDGLRICHLGDLERKLQDSELEELDGVDILMIPVGGTYTLDPKEAGTVISQIEPKIVIPMHYKMSEAKGSTFEKLLPVEEFLKEQGEKGQILPKLQVSRDKIPEEMQIVVLERKNG